MNKFKVGQKVLVTGSTYHPKPGAEGMIGKVCELKQQTSFGWGVFTPDKSDYWFFNKTDLEPITEPPEEITLNGATYVRKPEPAHEWKFGDWARHPEYGVVFVGNVNNPDEIWCVVQDSDGWHYGHNDSPNNLTYISSATIPE